MDETDAKKTLHRYLRSAREAVLWKASGLDEYDARRPLTPTGTNLLGLVKHLAMVEAAYFGSVFDRPIPERLPWWDDDADDNADMWVTEAETRDDVVRLYRRVWEHADATIEALDLDAPGKVPWFSPPDVTLHWMLVHVIAETSRHAGQADIVREQVDGAVGLNPANGNLPEQDAAGWEAHVAQVEAAARAASGR